MISEKVLGNIKKDHSDKLSVFVEFEWFETEKKRISKIANDGEEIGICISDELSDGDIIAETPEKIYVVEIVPTRLIKVLVSSMFA